MDDGFKISGSYSYSGIPAMGTVSVSRSTFPHWKRPDRYAPWSFIYPQLTIIWKGLVRDEE